MSQWYVYPRDMCIPAHIHISLVICVSPQIWPPVICVSPTPLPSKQILELDALNLFVTSDAKSLIYWLTIRVCILRNIYRTWGRECYSSGPQAVVWKRRELQSSYISFKSFTHRRTLAHELATYLIVCKMSRSRRERKRRFYFSDSYEELY